MAGKHKLKNYTELSSFENTFEPIIEHVKFNSFSLKGNWLQGYFKNNNPIVLELGCGKGEYTVEQAIAYPNKNFIGCDIKGARMWRGAKTATENNLKNVAFIRTRIEFIESFFSANEVDEIWITFPDPLVKDRKEKSRLTSPQFLDRYQNILKQNGLINLKHDSTFFYDYTLEVLGEHKHPILKNTANLYDNYLPNLTDLEEVKRLSIQTFYEKKFSDEGHKIKYLQFKLAKNETQLF